MNYLSFIILSFFCFSCTSTEVKKTNQDYKKLKHVVFVPGFYGTKLKSRASGNQVWLTAKNAIFCKENVAVHGFELPYSEKLIPTTILDKVQVIPGVYSKDVYGDIVDYLENIDQQNTMVHTLTYDWRKDYFKAVLKLDKLVQEIKAKGGEKIILVAHSLGGLLSSYYLRYGIQEPTSATESWYGASQFREALIATVPYKGSLLSFRNVFKGVNFIYNENLLNADILSSFETNYQMMPIYKNSFLNNKLEVIDHSVIPFEQWESHGWGFLGDHIKVSADTRKKRLSFVKTTLNNTNMMFQKIHNPINLKSPYDLKLTYFKGINRPTMSRGILFKVDGKIIPLFDKEDIIKYLPEDSYEKLFDDGDETIASVAAELPQSFKDGFKGALDLREIEAVHSRVFDHKAVQAKLTEMIQ